MNAVMYEVDKVTINDRLRPLGDVSGLVNSIRVAGLANPIQVRSDGTLIAGRHRLEAFRQLGRTEIPAVILDIDDLTAELLEIDENLRRSELTKLEEGEHIRRREEVVIELGLRASRGGNGANQHRSKPVNLTGLQNDIQPEPKITTKDIATEVGMSESTARRRKRVASNINSEVRERLKAVDQDRERDKKITDNATQLDKLARMPADKQKDIVTIIESGEAKDVKAAQKVLKQREFLTNDLPVQVFEVDNYQLIHCDIEHLAAQIPPNSIDVIITDPPYPKEYLPLWDTLGELAVTVLKPGGSLFAMSGQSYLPQVFKALDASLTYNWTCAYYTPGGQAPQMWQSKVNTFWKPVLWFTKGKYDGKWLGDVFKSDTNNNDKRFHHWGQSESGMAAVVEKGSNEGDVILDPFLGGGTTGVVALSLNRGFIGADIDKNSISIAERRLIEVCRSMQVMEHA